MTDDPGGFPAPLEHHAHADHAALVGGDAEALYEFAPCGLLSTAPDGLITKVNETLLQWLDHQRTDLVGRRTFAQLLTPGGRIYHETHFAPMLQMQGSVREIAVDIVAASGARLPVLVNAVLDRDAAGAPAGVRVVLFPATERREYERELVRARQRAEESDARSQVLARTLQQTLIPPAPPAPAGLEIAGRYRPEGDGAVVGGDFYDVFEIGHGGWVAVVGDVCGKGAEAAVVTALVRYTVRAAAIRVDSPVEILTMVNEALLRHETDRFCTVSLLRFIRGAKGWQCLATSAGHPLPLLRRPGKAPAPIGRHGSLLGAFPAVVLHEDDLMLEVGDAVVLYTDGVTEARQDREEFGEDRLHQAVARHGGSAHSLATGLLSEVMDFQGSVPRDDIAIVAVQVSA